MKRSGLKIAGIGIFHILLYGYLVPFVIYPRFGGNGLAAAVVVAVMVSAVVLGSLWRQKNKKAKGE